jgi:hypothetical protein
MMKLPRSTYQPSCAQQVPALALLLVRGKVLFDFWSIWVVVSRTHSFPMKLPVLAVSPDELALPLLVGGRFQLLLDFRLVLKVTDLS